MKTMKAHQILGQGQEEMEDRAKTYDAPEGERSMGKAVEMFNTLHGTELTETEGWQFMEILKMVRSSQGEFKLDNFIDGAAYAALAGEAAANDAEKPKTNWKQVKHGSGKGVDILKVSYVSVANPLSVNSLVGKQGKFVDFSLESDGYCSATFEFEKH